VGISDHSLDPVLVPALGTAMGAVAIEKHFCLSRVAGGVDSAFSMEPHEMKMLVEEVNRAYLALGKISYGVLEAEKHSRIFKRSIYASKDIKAGETFTKDNIKVIRPGDGLHPREFESMIEKKTLFDISKGSPIQFSQMINC